MIVELTVEDLAIIDRSQLRFGSGFTVLTGETGAGKSLLIDAMDLALGGRADSDLVRAGRPRAFVSMVVDLTARPDLQERCAELGLTSEEGLLYVQREVLAEGRSQCRVGGKLIPVASLKALGGYLVDLHGQHDHQSLLDPSRHLEYLDGWIGEPADRAKERVRSAFEAAASVRRKLDALRHGRRELEQRLDLLRHQVDEIEKVSPAVGETAELEVQIARLQHAEKLAEAGFAAVGQLADDEGNAIDRLASAIKNLEGVVRFDESLEALVAPLREALFTADEAARNVRTYAESLEADPNLLDDRTARLDALRRLVRKYGDDEAAVLAHLETARQELEELSLDEHDEESLGAELAALDEKLSGEAALLSSLRRERAVVFAETVQRALADLAMDRAVFEVAFESGPIDANGMDRVEFYFSANAGEPPRPLAKIASGGEISRVMLAIKTVFAGKAGVPTLIFDEVDTGLGGRAAAAVARKLEALAEHYQVLVISHLPQIAARGAKHYRIEKAETEGRAVTTVRELTIVERVDEIARMLAGDSITEAAKANARDMLGLTV